MKLALYSDLHTELRRKPLALPLLDVDVVILAGDIGSHTRGLDWAAATLRSASASPPVVYVAGNHEYYETDLGLLDELRSPTRKDADIHVLERDVLMLPGLRVLGCTLWSGFDLHGAERTSAAMFRARHGINDYWLVRAAGGRRLTPRDTLDLHRKSVRWLDHELGQPFDGSTVVVTHFAPHRGCVQPDLLDDDVSPYFVTDLAWLMAKHRIDLWCFGHTHHNVDFVAENGCRVISNQLGYTHERCEDFRPDLVIEVGA